MSGCSSYHYPAQWSGPYVPLAPRPQPYAQFCPVVRTVPGYFNPLAHQPVVVFSSPDSYTVTTVREVTLTGAADGAAAAATAVRPHGATAGPPSLPPF